MPKVGHKLSEYITLPSKRTPPKPNKFRDEFFVGQVDPLVKKKKRVL